MIKQMSFNLSHSMTNLGSTIPLIENYQTTNERIGVGMYPSLMGTFYFSTLVSYIHATLVSYQKLILSVPITQFFSFKTSYFEDPWVLPFPCESVKGRVHYGMDIQLFVVEIPYRAIHQATTDPDPTSSWMKEDNQFPNPIWVQNYFNSLDGIDTVFPYDKAIIETMTRIQWLWDDMHHRNSFPK